MCKKDLCIVTKEFLNKGVYDVSILRDGNEIKIASDIDEKTYNILMYYLRQVFDVVNGRENETETETNTDRKN